MPVEQSPASKKVSKLRQAPKRFPELIWAFFNSSLFNSGILVIGAAIISLYYSIYAKCSAELTADNTSAGMQVEELLARKSALRQSLISLSLSVSVSDASGVVVSPAWRNQDPKNTIAVEARKEFVKQLLAAKNPQASGLYSEFVNRSDSDLFNHARRTFAKWNPDAWLISSAGHAANNVSDAFTASDIVPKSDFSIYSKEWVSYFDRFNPLSVRQVDFSAAVEKFEADFRDLEGKLKVSSNGQQSSYIGDEVKTFDKFITSPEVVEVSAPDESTELANTRLQNSASRNALVEMRVCTDKMPKVIRVLISAFGGL